MEIAAVGLVKSLQIYAQLFPGSGVYVMPSEPLSNSLQSLFIGTLMHTILYASNDS